MMSIELNDTDPAIKPIDRFIAEKYIQGNEWFKISKHTVKQLDPYIMRNESTQTEMYNHRDIEIINDEELEILSEFPINIMNWYFDLECNSHQYLLPNPNISEDCITQISVYYKIYKSTSDSDVGSYLITWLPTSTIEESRVDLTSTESQKGSTESKSNVKPEMIEYKLII